MTYKFLTVIAGLSALFMAGCREDPSPQGRDTTPSHQPRQTQQTSVAEIDPVAELTQGQALALAAMDQIGKTTIYDPAYVKLRYPGGDVPAERGVCTDVVVRALRKCGVDLQVLIHEDMTASFKSYPDLWQLKQPDANIDHRRVPNIAAFLKRKGKALPITTQSGDYEPGDIVVWRLSNGRVHIGIVSDVPANRQGRYKVIHNIGSGTQIDDRLFSFEITGHFRYF